MTGFPFRFALAILLASSLPALAQLPDACAWQWQEEWSNRPLYAYGPVADLGGELHTWGSREPGAPRLLRFDVATDAWVASNLPDAVARVSFGYARPIAVGYSPTEVAFFGQFDWAGESVGGIRYELATKEWRPISAAGAMTGSEALWIGSGFVVIGSDRLNGLYDTIADRWTPLPLLPVEVHLYASSAVWTGQSILVVATDSGVASATVMRWAPGEAAWTILGEAPPSRGPAVWVDDELYYLPWGDGLLRYRLDGSYERLSIPPRPGSAGRATGEQLLVWNRKLAITAGLHYPPCDACGPPWLAPEWLIYDLDGGTWSMVSPTSESNRSEAFVSILAPDGIVRSVSWSGNVHTLSLAESTWRPAHWEDVGIPEGASVLWTGEELVAYGGSATSRAASSGVRFDPVTGEGRRLSRIGARPRTHHIAVWTGDAMLVLGGGGDLEAPETNFDPSYYDGGDRWRPATDSWEPLAFASPPPLPRRDAVAVWTGSEALVWGGTTAEETPSQGFRYSPATGEWRYLPADGEPDPRDRAVGAWTGKEFLVWGGYWNGFYPADGGALYDPELDRWRWIPPIPIGGFEFAGGFWTGSELFTWTIDQIPTDSGDYRNVWKAAAFDPLTNVWRRLPDREMCTWLTCKTSMTPWTMVEVGASAIRLETMTEFDTGVGLPKAISMSAGSRAEATGGLWTGSELLTWNSESIERLVPIGEIPAPPSLVWPSPNATNVRFPLHLRWSAAEGAVSFAVDLGPPDAMQRIAESTTLTGHTIVDLESATTYRWRVTAFNDCGVNWTDGSFRTAAFYADMAPVPPTPAWTTIDFTDQSTGHPRAWYWEFGDGTTSTERTPRKIYIDPGRYEARLTVTADEGTASTARTIEILPARVDLNGRREWLGVGSGADGFRTLIQIFNTNSFSPVPMRFTFTSAGAATMTKDYLLAPGETRTWSNALEEIFGIDAPSIGRLTLEWEWNWERPFATARRWRERSGGQVGGDLLTQRGDRHLPLRYHGLGRAGTRGELHLSSDEEDLEVRMTAYDTHGSRGTQTLQVIAGSSMIVEDLAAVFGLADGAAFDLEVAANGELASACLIEDLSSGDVLSVPEGGNGIQLAASTVGLDDQPYATRAVLWREGGAGAAQFVPRYALAPTATGDWPLSADSATTIWNDVLPESFGLSSVVGRLDLSDRARGWAEVWTEGSAGRVGVDTGPADPGAYGPTLIGISDDATHRSNLWIGTEVDAVVRVRFYDSSGSRLVDELVEVPAGGRFFSNVAGHFGLDGITDARINLYAISGNGRLRAWATVIDRATLDARMVSAAD